MKFLLNDKKQKKLSFFILSNIKLLFGLHIQELKRHIVMVMKIYAGLYAQKQIAHMLSYLP